MTTALIYVSCSAVILALLAGIFRIEDAREGKPLILKKARALFDRLCVFLQHQIARIGMHVVYPVFHYSAHRLLRRLYTFTQKISGRIEQLMRQNRQIAKKTSEKKEKTHLDAIAQHKEDVALTDAQKLKMRSH